MAEWIQTDVLKSSVLKSFLPEYLAPLVLILFNSVIIPLLVDIVANLEDHETVSGKNVTILTLNLVFMILNTVFIPLTNFVTMR